ncbi:hypothetical protein OESDEN_02606 [Oesophagostomum dentatum]|uniref:SXP/RAL-2 family protein Ani s 5-like cation-binding domain-containing protein n=1 Tax=Oesophagostomum dentatum TaxID=61180 RepID=A0A0B1TJH7_OESDE|nr:hypothetical protein OESDEN_02606 [Oesophagostomum dentatum]
MFRYIFVVSLFVISQQYPAQRNNVENVPAWYQGHQKQMPSAYEYDRAERPAQMNMNYQHFPTYARPSYHELTMSPLANSRRYPVGGQDPNAELLAAIKDVVAKFKASLDESGLDQDVRLMSNQLRNTWQQLRTGVNRGFRAVKQSAENSLAHASFGPVNEQLGRLLEKAADDENRTASRQQLRISP